ncbi:phosphopentomutase [Caldicellulosiruptor saccharolyticus DSM 8903]|uniref:Phosphopentomutase n=1 Tax=Caldicellulosiruptor saccharolyticus (strain ATCC 43494 / DSM 8903 / Tp8T 6331) TaxID=351627 RepID=A4XLV9_CALS8|nr:phosphopentomutase [Caldicellulosiruptor saccharolyticus]ABP67894.1 phosphopentomutase [Caldicellulosiruptor saccharolyticus DSM 8903]
MKVVLIVLDSVGVGQLEDAKLYGDEGSNTLSNTSYAVGGIELKNMYKLGIGNITDIKGTPPNPNPIGAFGKSKEKSKGKDTITGHWEIAGVVLEEPFKTFPNGFPEELIEEFERQIGRKVLGNKVASGTEIIKELGEQHMKTGYPIVYTSADSVFQIAAHEDVIPLDELYRICEIARKMLVGKWLVARVIARPFIGKGRNSFVRTYNRKDFAVEPPYETLLDNVKEAGLEVVGIGKIEDIFAKRGLSMSIHTEGNMDGINKTLQAMDEVKDGLIFTNLVDYDMLYGHRNDPIGYAKALLEFDERLPEIIEKLEKEDILIITADHGCDPTTSSTDHSREHVPILIYGQKIKKGYNLGVRESFSDIGQTVAEYLKVKTLRNGESFLKEILI